MNRLRYYRALCTLVVVAPACLESQRVETGFLDRSVTTGGRAYRYQVYVPAAYAATSDRWPAILFLHGAGERGSDGLLQTQVGLGTAIRRAPARYPAIVVFPQVPTDSVWVGVPADMAIAALDQTMAEFRIDPDRVYLTGLSMGGNGTWNLAYRYPDRFAAIAPICGFVSPHPRLPNTRGIVPADSGNPFTALARRLARLPTWIVHGEVDQVVPVAESRQAAEAMRAAGGDVRYTELIGVDHNSWDATYASAQFKDWLFAQRRSRAGASRAPLHPGEHEVVLNGVRHSYRVRGSGATKAPPVVFLHGGPGQGSTHFETLAGPHLETSLSLVYFDQRGSGRSERLASAEYSIPILVEDIEALRRHLGVPQIALIGHSFGGLLALEYAAKYPRSVSRIVFAAGLWDAPYQCRLRVQRLAELHPAAYERVRADTLAPDGTRRSDCDLEFSALRGAEREAYFARSMFPGPAVASRLDSVEKAHGIRNTGELGNALFSRGLLRHRFDLHDRIPMPVLVLAGGRDGAARPEGLRELARRLPNARYVEFPRAGHFVYLDEPERFAREVATFLSGRTR